MSTNIDYFSTIGKGGFHFISMLTLFISLLYTGLMAGLSKSWQLVGTRGLLIVLGLFIASIIGAVIINKSETLAGVIVGFLIMATGYGLLLGPVINTYTTASVTKILFVTSIVVAGLAIIGCIVPNTVQQFGTWLYGGLFVLLGGTLGIVVGQVWGLPMEGAMTWLDWAGVVIFSGYVIYDVNRLNDMAYTPNNAIRGAAAIYIDFVALFLRFLALFGTKKDD